MFKLKRLTLLLASSGLLAGQAATASNTINSISSGSNLQINNTSQLSSTSSNLPIISFEDGMQRIYDYLIKEILKRTTVKPQDINDLFNMLSVDQMHVGSFGQGFYHLNSLVSDMAEACYRNNRYRKLDLKNYDSLTNGVKHYTAYVNFPLIIDTETVEDDNNALEDIVDFVHLQNGHWMSLFLVFHAKLFRVWVRVLAKAGTTICTWERHFLQIFSLHQSVKWVPGYRQ